ncbi:prepilin peptidase [Escherichia coli]|uniref:prepilin peptidase n=1 Tax=Escherichia coli TaxID=562 RepID=UPI0035154A8B
MLLFVFFYASVITSFLCLAVDRLPHQLKWREEPDENLTIYSPPSHCNECKTKIRWWGLDSHYRISSLQGKMFKL